MNKIDALHYQLVINLFRVLRDVEIKRITSDEAIGHLTNLRKIYFDDMAIRLNEYLRGDRK